MRIYDEVYFINANSTKAALILRVVRRLITKEHLEML